MSVILVTSPKEENKFPTGSEFGIDRLIWTTGKKFTGIKDIPKGFHMITYLYSGKEESMCGMRNSILLWVEKPLYVFTWDPQSESLQQLPDDDRTLQGYKDRLNNFVFEDGLAQYPFAELNNWLTSTTYVSKELTEAITPLNGKPVQSSTEASDVTQAVTIPTVFFTHIELKVDPTGLTAKQLTKHNMDKTFVLQQLLRANKLKQSTITDTTLLLGELQISFILFLIGQSFEAFEQWKNIIQFFCQCDDGLILHPTLFKNFFGVFNDQLLQLPKDFFTDELTSANFLIQCLKGVFSSGIGTDYEEGIVDHLKELNRTLQEKFGVFMTIGDSIGEDQEVATYRRVKNEDDDDYQPVVVFTEEMKDMLQQTATQTDMQE